MSTTSYRFKLGTLDCLIVRDGEFAYAHPAQTFFANAPQEHLAPVLREHGIDPVHWEQYISPYPGLLIDTGRQRVLVDTGAGNLAPTTGQLISNLRAEGIAPEDIDIVILTHVHPDHAGGCVDAEGRPNFPNARYMIWKQEWDYWIADPDLAELNIPDPIRQLIRKSARETLPALRDRIELIDQEAEVVPGIRVIATPGHTPGHIAVAISSGGQQLLSAADVAVHPIHLEQPGWYCATEILPAQGVVSKRRLMNWAADEQVLVHGFHFPWPGLGHVVRNGDAWQWQPIAS